MAAPSHWIMQPVDTAVQTNIAFRNTQKRVARIIGGFSINSGNNPGTTTRAPQSFVGVSAFSTTAANQLVLIDDQHFQYNVASGGYALTTGYDVLYLEVQYEGEQAGTSGQ